MIDLTRHVGHEKTSALVELITSGVRVLDLSRPMEVGMAQSPNHPEYRLTMPRRHGDMTRSDGGSAANDLLVTGTHVGTHIDALGHVSHCGEVYGGTDAASIQEGGRLASHGVDEINPIVTRGVLLDIAALHKCESLPGGYEVTTDDLDAAVDVLDSPPTAGDVILVRTGWGAHWGDAVAFLGKESGVPGVSEAGAVWLAAHSPVAVGGDSIAFERLEAGNGHALLPAHRVLLVESGINIMETMDLDILATAGVNDFVIVVAPLNLVGATGSPIRPLAIIGAA